MINYCYNYMGSPQPAPINYPVYLHSVGGAHDQDCVCSLSHCVIIIICCKQPLLTIIYLLSSLSYSTLLFFFYIIVVMKIRFTFHLV